MSDTEWSISITDDDQRTMTADQVVAEYHRGGLDLIDTYVWREGMDDWVPLGQSAELMSLIQKGPSGAAPESPFAGHDLAPQSSTQLVDMEAAGEQALEPGLMGTMMMDSPMDEGGQPPAPDPSAPAAARVDDGPVEDVFAAKAREQESSPGDSAAEEARKLGERNEASALFSLDDIRAAATGKEPAPGAGPGPGISAPKKEEEEKDSAEIDLMSLGSGGGLASAGSFAPPQMTAPVAEPKPEPKPEPAQAMAAPQLGAPKKSRTGLLIAAFLGVGIAAAVTVFFVMRKPSTETTASVDKDSVTSTSGAAKGTGTAANKEGDESWTSESATDDGDTSTSGADQSTSTSSAGPSATGTSKGIGKLATPGSTTSKTTKKGDTKPTTTTTTKPSATSTKTATPTATKEDKPAGGTGEFNIDAARAALGGAAGRAAGCGQPDGPKGRGRASVTFAPSGFATTAIVGPPFAGTAVGSCVAVAFRSASVPPFSGAPMTVHKSFFIK